MSLPAYYPPATRKNDGSGTGTYSGVGKWKLVLHTTETAGIPGYQGGALAPHLTYYCAKRQWVQHSPLTRPAESLMTYDDDQVIQVELVCYSAKNIADASPSRLWVGDLTDEHLTDIAAFTNWLRQYLPIAPRSPGRAATSYGQANTGGFRMTAKTFFAYDGILGHQHTPSPNTHWDPGAFPWDRYLSLLTGGQHMDHEYDSWDEFTAEHQWDGPKPAWVDSNGVWAAYVAAGGTSVEDSYNLAFTRSDMAWVWNRFIRHNRGNTVGDLEKRVRRLEVEGGGGGGATVEAVVNEVIRRLTNG